MENIKKLTKITIVFIFVFFIIAETKCYAKQIIDSDFIKAQDKILRNEYGTGTEIILRGVNAGGWLVQEPWMCPTESSRTVQDQKTIESTLVRRFGKTRAQELLNCYRDSFWTEKDFDNCETLGMNVIRLPFWYMNIVDENGNLREDAFDRIDWFVEQSGKRGIYVILDMHGAPGSQNGEVHSGDSLSDLGLWKGVDVVYNQNLFIEVWKMVAEHYQGNPVVAGYDLLNEPYSEAGKHTDSQVWELYNRAYNAIRNIDKEHIVIMEATWEPYNLPNPDLYGWTNVMYEYHSYNYDNITDSDAQLESINNKIDLINESGYNVPSYIGETSFFANMDSWEKCLNALNDAEISWTLWNYKVTGDGTNSWGIYNINTSKANLTMDSFETIKNKWMASVTDAACINSQLVKIIDRFISYSPFRIEVGGAASGSVSNQIYTEKSLLGEVKGEVAKIKVEVKCGMTKIKAKVKGRKISFSWKKVKNSRGYEIYLASKKKGKYKKIKSITSGKKKKCSYKVKKRGTYFIKIRAYSKINKKKKYGKFSKVVKIKVK